MHKIEIAITFPACASIFLCYCLDFHFVVWCAIALLQNLNYWMTVKLPQNLHLCTICIITGCRKKETSYKINPKFQSNIQKYLVSGYALICVFWFHINCQLKWNYSNLLMGLSILQSNWVHRSVFVCCNWSQADVLYAFKLI